MDRTVPIRRSLLINLVGVVILLSGAIITTMTIGSGRAVRTLATALMQRTIDQTEGRLQRFFEPVGRGLHLARAWGRAGLLDDDRTDEMIELFEPFMREFPQITSVLVADSRGREFMLLRVGAEWRARLTRRDEWDDRVRFIRWSNADPTRRESEETLTYDPRQRPWFIGAVEKNGLDPAPDGAAPLDDPALHWTAPYVFFTTKEPGITASIPFDRGDEIDHVAGFDVLLSDITRFTSGLRVSERGRVIVLTDDRRLIGVPSGPRLDADSARTDRAIVPTVEMGTLLLANALAAIESQADEPDRPFQFEGEDETWWGAARPFELSPDRRLWMTVLIPQADLLGSLSRLRDWMLLLTLVILALAIARVVVIARRFSRPIEALVRESDRISRGNFKAGLAVASRVREVRDLAAAHERMRSGLESLMKLERDLQIARQIQQSTLPDELPGVPGFELAAWSDPADETGGDMYDAIQGLGGGDDATEDDGRVLLLLADATGHGIGPALAASEIRALLRMAVRTGSDLSRIARLLNEQLCADLPADRFITAWLGLVDPAAGTLTGFSAGQAPLLLFDGATGAFEVCKADTMPFGLVDDIPIKLSSPRVLAPGSIYAVLSDGIYEAGNGTGEQFGMERVQAVLSEHAHLPPDRIIRELWAAVNAFTGGTPADDDRTAILVKRAGP